MRLSVLFQYTGNTEIAKHQFCMLLVSEEEITWLDILMQNVASMTICQCGSTLQGNAAEPVKITIQLIFCYRSSTEILHQFIIAMLAVYIGLAIVVYMDNHLKIKVQNGLKYLLVDVETRIIYFQDKFLMITLHEKDLSLTRIVAQALNLMIIDALQDEVVIIYGFLMRFNPICPEGFAHVL